LCAAGLPSGSATASLPWLAMFGGSRLVDQFDSYDQCLAEGNFAPCYQTLTFCADGRVNANLEYRQQGRYELHDSTAIARLPAVTVEFDLETATSPQLPGRHRWERVDPLSKDCGP
jgi:hypothetical protein